MKKVKAQLLYNMRATFASKIALLSDSAAEAGALQVVGAVLSSYDPSFDIIAFHKTVCWHINKREGF